ncbi:MAG: methyltransferase domain-containing protein [Acidobacteriota bacterium]
MLQRLKARWRYVERSVFSVAQAGRSVLCRLCGWKGRRFMRGGVCPRCGTRARHRLIPYAAEHFGVDLGAGALLHAGPSLDEVTYVLRHFSPRPYHRLDLQAAPIVNLTGDLCAIPLDDASVDRVLIWHVLEHVPDDRGALRELHRVLRPGGQALVSVPIHPPRRPETFEDAEIPRSDYARVHGHYDHVRSCGLDYGERLREAGFTVETLDVHDLPRDRALFWGLSRAHVAWCAAKA